MQRVALIACMPDAYRTARLHGGGGHPLVHDPKLDHMRGCLEGRCYLLCVAVFVATHNVSRRAGPEHGCIGLERTRDTRHRGQRLNIDVDSFCCVQRCIATGGHHQRDRFTHMAQFTASQGMTRRRRHFATRFRGNRGMKTDWRKPCGQQVVGGENAQYTRHCARGRSVY